jgi:hypothetical protein
MKRRSFLKLVGISAAIVAIPVIPTFETAIFDYPEVKAVLARFPEPLLPNQKLAVARYIVAEIRNGSYDMMESMYAHFPNSTANSYTNWK